MTRHPRALPPTTTEHLSLATCPQNTSSQSTGPVNPAWRLAPIHSWFCLSYPERNAVLPADLAPFLEGWCSVWLCTTLCPLDLDTAQLLGSTPGTLKTTPAAEQEQLDSQLRLVGVGPRVGHAEHPTACVGEVGAELIFERLAPVGLSTWNRRAQSEVTQNLFQEHQRKPRALGHLSG